MASYPFGLLVLRECCDLDLSQHCAGPSHRLLWHCFVLSCLSLSILCHDGFSSLLGALVPSGVLQFPALPTHRDLLRVFGLVPP